jgi:inosine-uridine nucleoside N-ribohydrolase
MGGGIEKGNVPPNRLAEYNIALDPQSAEKVFNCGIPITMIGIDATAFVPASNEFKNIIKKTKPVNKTAQILKLIIMNNETDFDQFYDPLAAAWFFNKEIFNSTLRGNINVPSTGKESGKTILNINSKGNVNIPLEANAKLFYDLIQKLIEKSQLSNRN